MRRGRAAAAGCSPPNRGGPPELNDTGPPRAQRPPSVVTTSWSRPMAGHHPGDRPGRPAGPVSTFSIPHSPATRPAPWPWASARVGPAARRRRSRDAGQAAALGYGRHSCQPATANAAPSPSGQARCRQATTPPADHGARGTWTRCARPGGRPHRATPGPARRGQGGGSAADTRGLSVRTPGGLGRLGTGRLNAGRPLDRLDGHPTADRTRRTGNDRPGRRPSILAAGDHPLGGPTSPGSRRLGRSATHDGSAVMAPAPRP
jgi:hypothetical protein